MHMHRENSCNAVSLSSPLLRKHTSPASLARARSSHSAARSLWSRKSGRKSFRPMADKGLTGFACEKSLATDRNLEITRRKFPSFCCYHLAHNILGGRFEQHSACTVAPFSGGVCAYGSHADPASTAAARESRKSQVALGKTLQLPLGFSRRAGSSKLTDGCICCQGLDFDEACTSCGRAWISSRRTSAKPVAADDAAWYKWCQKELQRQDEEGGDGSEDYKEEDDGGHPPYGYDGHEGGGEEEWQGEEAYEGEEWYEEWNDHGGEGGGGEEDSESTSESSSGEAEPSPKRARIEHAMPSAIPGASAAQASEVLTLRLQLEAAQANNRALEAELKLAKTERDAALARL
jgi:hypothetical protein